MQSMITKTIIDCRNMLCILFLLDFTAAVFICVLISNTTGCKFDSQ